VEVKREAGGDKRHQQHCDTEPTCHQHHPLAPAGCRGDDVRARPTADRAGGIYC
jgi:hypothetical protein